MFQCPTMQWEQTFISSRAWILPPAVLKLSQFWIPWCRSKTQYFQTSLSARTQLISDKARQVRLDPSPKRDANRRPRRPPFLQDSETKHFQPSQITVMKHSKTYHFLWTKHSIMSTCSNRLIGKNPRISTGVQTLGDPLLFSSPQCPEILFKNSWTTFFKVKFLLTVFYREPLDCI